MSGAAASEAEADASARSGWQVSPAMPGDIPAVVDAVSELLRELGGAPPPVEAMRAAALGLLEDPLAGAVLVAEAGERVVDVRSFGTPTSGLAQEGEVVGVHSLKTPTNARDPAAATPVPGSLVGVLAMSWQSAIHIPGRYALIQDLWVRPRWRGSGVGAGLLAALFALARARGAARVEVGLPRESFAGIAATEAFYVANGFTALGPRMRRDLA
ncbi:MAG TPA: GNAT family N-acetyltransferase [Solirubrobacteraceae bacterium]|nr:GNAT family N-acetyltransferase [Solirubrobacteraceae bacterium]